MADLFALMHSRTKRLMPKTFTTRVSAEKSCDRWNNMYEDSQDRGNNRYPKYEVVIVKED